MSKSNLNRRQFHVRTGAIALGGAVVLPLGNQALAAGAASDANACDFQASFMTRDAPYRKDSRPHARHNTPHGNWARIQLESLIDVIDIDAGQSERFVLIAACRTEWVYADDRLFQLPSGEYRNIYSVAQERHMGQSLTYRGGRPRGVGVADKYRSLQIDIATLAGTRSLSTHQQIVQATADNKPLVARTTLEEPDRKLRYVLEYPIKTMNFQPKTDSFQVDTGPLLVPDFESDAESAIDRLEMAHVAYNQLDRAEFILRRPTPISDEAGRTLCEVLHYSEVRELPATNELLANERT